MEKETCPTCGRNLAKRREPFSGVFLSALVKTYKYARALPFPHGQVKIDSVPVSTADFAKELTSPEYARLNMLVHFGFLDRPPNVHSGQYLVQLEKCRAFLAGETKIHSPILWDPIASSYEPDPAGGPMNVEQVPNLEEIKREFGAVFSFVKSYPANAENTKPNVIFVQKKPGQLPQGAFNFNIPTPRPYD